MDVPSLEGFSQPVLHSEVFDLNSSFVRLDSTSTAIESTVIQPWQEPLPISVFQHAKSVKNSFSETEGYCKIAAFMEFIFTPGRFTEDAICKAFKVSLFSLN